MYLIDNPDVTDPAINLALEEYCLKNLDPNHDYMLFYINAPCVIFGKHQNPFVEANVAYVMDKGIGLIRRISGGGAVYHDHGNLNFSYITAFGKKGLQAFRDLLQPVLHTLESLGLLPELKENNTIFIEGEKISGNAQYTNLNRMLSHGTLLFDTDLKALLQTLDSISDILSSRGVDSTRSRVTNISKHLNESMDIHTFRQKLIAEAEKFLGGLENYKLSETAWDEVLRLAKDKYQSWEWNHGNTPAFSARHRMKSGSHVSSIRLHVERGYVRKIEFEEDDPGKETAASWEEKLLGKPYDAIPTF
jgi:lipoate-protein ligase A